ncbi:hypothetical protein [Oceanisphaera sp. KMM 10153]|uniref:hypothetical protein n=1 Tax=Oceanisphaera submarina TaxID=3390193 RepID=UPI003976BE1C
MDSHTGRVLAGFMATFPRINIHLEVTNRRVALVAEGMDIVIRIRPARRRTVSLF